MFLVSIFIHFATGPRALIDVELYPAFREAQAGGWLCIFSMDRLMVPEVSAPYAGWPPLYSIWVGLMAKAGFSYLGAVAMMNALCSLLPALNMSVLMNRLQFKQHPFYVWVFILFSASQWVSMTTPFAHALIPLGMVLMALSLTLFLTSSNQNSKQIFSAFVFGFFTGMMNWACYFFVPAVVLVYGIQRWSLIRKKNKTIAATPFKSVFIWVCATTVGCITAFAAFQFLHLLALHDTTALSEPISGASRIVVRAMPSGSNVAGALFYTVIRCAICVLPIAMFLVIASKSRSSEEVKPKWPASTRLIVYASILAPFLFVICFSGEMAPSAHVFHGRLFVVAAAFSLVCIVESRLPISTRTSSIFALLCVFMATISSQAYRMMDPAWISSPTLQSKKIGLLTSAEYSDADAGASAKKFSDVIRTIILQGISWPTSENRRAGCEFLAKSDAWAHHNIPLIQKHVRHGEVIVAHINASLLATYHFDRDVICLKDQDEGRVKLRKLIELIGHDKIVFVCSPTDDCSWHARLGLKLKIAAQENDLLFLRMIDYDN